MEDSPRKKKNTSKMIKNEGLTRVGMDLGFWAENLVLDNQN
jgi:hypothetical protein